MGFLATAIAGPLIGVRQLDAASTAQIRLANVRSDLDALLRIQLAEETSLRGYLATHDPLFLDEDKPPDPAFDRQARQLEARLREVEMPAAAIQTVDDMRARHTTWERDVALPLLQNPGSLEAYTQQATGKIITDQMSRDASQLRDLLTQASVRVDADLRRRINATVAISAGIVTLFAIVALWYAIGRATAVARLAEGQVLVDALQRTLRVGGQRLAATQIGSAYASATREALIGGDVLDVWRAGPTRGWFLIADTSGKGIEAARHAAFTQYAIRALAADADDPAAVLRRYNRLFLNTFDDPSVFVVAFLGTFDARSQTLRYASAGHGTAYVRRGALIERLPPTGALVGIDPEERYGTETVPLALGDVVLLATDGLTEARGADGEMLGEDRVVAILRDAPPDPQALCDLLVASADAYSGGVQDDLAIIALRVVAEDESVSTEFSTIAGSDAAS
ncbi:MAG: SpoIIE family protein phosphatase [Candidatus Eremiobacteraeota bacterium]|nr:SpoIIE family protein phosphatase [Candidatus Eremiobacteraeota bacterium]